MYLLFSTTSNIASKFIRLVTWGNYSHVEALDKDGFLTGAEFPKGGVSQPYQKRFELATKCRLVKVDIADTEAFYKFLYAQIGKPYDWKAIFGYLFRKNWDQDNEWFCSELIAKAAIEGKTPLATFKSFKISPRDLLMNPNVETITTDKEEAKQLLDTMFINRRDEVDNT